MARTINRGRVEKICISCTTPLNADNITEGRLKHEQYICTPCARKRDNKLTIKNKNKKANKRFQIKIKVMKEYGNKCACCGEDQIEFLTIDHINNDGAIERKTISSGGHNFYSWLLKNNCPKDKYQILCFNCNCSNGFLGYCPHKTTNNNLLNIPIKENIRVNSKNSKEKICIWCRIPLTLENSNINNTKNRKHICNECILKENQIYQLKLKLMVMKEYGNKCECCEENIFEFLTIDHINGNGGKERKELKINSGSNFYRWLIKNNYPKDNYRILCYSCNCVLGCYGYCPHQKDRETFQKEQDEVNKQETQNILVIDNEEDKKNKT
jgi:hypothetical protein